MEVIVDQLAIFLDCLTILSVAVIVLFMFLRAMGWIFGVIWDLTERSEDPPCKTPPT